MATRRKANPGDLLLVQGVGSVVVTDYDCEDLYLGTDESNELRVFNEFQIIKNLTEDVANV